MGVASPKSHSHVVTGHAAGHDDWSVKFTLPLFPTTALLNCAVGLGHGVGLGVGVGAGVGDGVGAGVADGAGVGLGVGLGVGVGPAGGTVTVRVVEREPPWLVTSSVIV